MTDSRSDKMLENEEFLVGAIDSGTSSTRFLIFDHGLKHVLCQSQREIAMKTPHSGWVEQDAIEIWETLQICMKEAAEKIAESGKDLSSMKCIGITNQRETCVVWNKVTGKPYCPAIVWMDTRTREIVDEFRQKEKTTGINTHHISGLIMSEYSCCGKLVWMLRNIPEITEDIPSGNVLFGTVDTWLIWKLTQGKSHVTDVTNASRTNFMNLRDLSWSPELLSHFGVPPEILPSVKSSSEIYGHITSLPPYDGIPLSGCLGDQHAALVGHGCFSIGQCKNTYGTGLFLLCNVGQEITFSTHGILTTVGYKLGPDAQVVYAMEGAVAIAGLLVRWLRDNLGMIKSASEIESLASEVKDSEGVYFVPAFSGLYTPYWDSSARGTVCGLTQQSNKHHIARAVLDAICFQTKDVMDAIIADSGQDIKVVSVDGGAVCNNLLMQMQADILGIRVSRGENLELTALGAAMAACIGVGLLEEKTLFRKAEAVAHANCSVFEPKLSPEEREKRHGFWKKAVSKSQNWL